MKGESLRQDTRATLQNRTDVREIHRRSLGPTQPEDPASLVVQVVLRDEV